MSVAKNNRMSRTKSFVQPFETLESRQMMSATVPHIPASSPADFTQPAIHANLEHGHKPHATESHATKSHGRIPIVSPIGTHITTVLPVVNPVTTTFITEPKVDW